MEITSINNSKIKYFKKLKIKKYRDQENLFLIEGEHLVNEALKKRIVKEIITTNDIDYNIPTYKVTPNIMKEISNQVTSTNIIAVCSKLNSRNHKNNIIILDNIQDPGNLGTIIRSAVAFNFDSIIISNDTVDLYNDKVIRSTEGMIFNINIIKTDIGKFIDNLDDSYLTVTTDVECGEDIRNLTYDKIAIVIGNEGKGVSENIKNKCKNKVNIKMNPNCESLNASIATSILMYEVYHG